MLIGAMNHPAHDVVEEMEWMARMGLDFIDLTLEPPQAASWRTDPHAIRRALDRNRLRVVGHTAYYLPIASAIEELRRGAVEELRRCLEVFAAIGASWMNIHPDRYAPMHDRSFFIQRNLQSLRELLPHAKKCGIGLMIENLPGDFNCVAQLGELLDPLPELGLHLDIGHANLMVCGNTAEEILAAYGRRLRHVHLHDNKGGSEDLHLPLGVGTVDVPRSIRALQACGYDGTITLEVFAPDPHYLAYSRDLLRRIWDEGARVGQAEVHSNVG
jgi:sugar phosphate isomerase/epimerase